MKNKLGVLFLILSYLFLAISIYVALNATNDCDNSLKVMFIALPGFAIGFFSFLLGKKRNLFYMILLIGFILITMKAYYLGKTAIGDC